MSIISPTPLLAAADLIERDGLAAGDYITVEGCRCTVGALSEAVTGSPVPPEDLTSMPLLDAVLRLVSDAVVSTVVDEDPIERIADWSDAPDRTASEVAQLLRRLADELLAQEAEEAAYRMDAQLAEQRHQLLDPPVMDYTVRTAGLELGRAA